MFCSYCERRIPTQLAVEHIQPKGLPAYAHLQGRWENFLLGCVNCNSTKGDKDVVLADVLLPDRDNTAAAYEYTMDGKITIPGRLTAAQRTMAERTLALTGLDRRASAAVDSNGQLVAIDRWRQRMEIWLIAQESKNDLQANPSARWTPIGPVWRYTMRVTDGLQTTINLGPVHRDDQAFSLQLSLGMSLPVPSQDEHLPDQIEAFVHQAGLQIQHWLFRALIEKADHE